MEAVGPGSQPLVVQIPLHMWPEVASDLYLTSRGRDNSVTLPFDFKT